MSTTLIPLLGILAPNMELLVICAIGASLPTAFFFWLKWWLDQNGNENPDEAIAAQSKADAAHHAQHGHDGHGHGHGHGHGAHA